MTAHTDRRDATDAQFADELARLDRLDVADESAEERVARALFRTDFPGFPWGSATDGDRRRYRRLARVAIDVLRAAPGTGEGPGPVPYDEHEREVLAVIRERDHLEDVADRLAAAIAPAEVLGEHSSANNPWLNALDYAEANSRPAPAPDTSTEDALHRVLDLADDIDGAFEIYGDEVARRIREAISGATDE